MNTSFFDRISLARWPLLVILSLVFSGLYAQPAEVKDDKAIRGIIMDFAKSYSAITESRNKATVLRYFHKNMTSNMFYFGINGRSRVDNSNYEGFERYLDKILRSDQLTIKYEVQNILRGISDEDVATYTYDVNFEIKEADGIWVRGNETVSMAFRKFGDEWKAVHFTVMGIEDEKLKGTCICEIFSTLDADGEVIVKTIVPSGKSYATHFADFKFKSREGNQLIRVEDRTYQWIRSGSLSELDEAGEVAVELGKAIGKKDAILLIIQQSLYAESCAKLKTHGE